MLQNGAPTKSFETDDNQSQIIFQKVEILSNMKVNKQNILGVQQILNE